MSDNKRYYYMRLKENFFDSDEMKILESMPDGYLYSNILLKLYLRSLKYNGRLMFNDLIPYTPPILATVTGHPVGVVEKALDIFGKLGLIEVMESGAIYMLNIQEFIGKTTTEADRRRKYDREIAAEKQKEISKKSVRNLGEISGKSTPEIEIEKDTEIEIEIEEPPAPIHPYAMERICKEKGLSESLSRKVLQWCEYRMENYEDSFLPKRFNTLISNVLAKSKKYGEEAVINQIGTAIDNHWKGMNLDKLDKKEEKRSGGRFNQMETQEYDFEAIEMALTGGNDGQIYRQGTVSPGAGGDEGLLETGTSRMGQVGGERLVLNCL